MRTPKEEREIHAGGYVYAENGERAERMEVYTSDYGYMLKFDRFCKENPEEWKVEKVETSGDDIVSKTYSCPASCLSFRRGKNKLTAENKKAIAERGAASLQKIHAESCSK